MNIEDKIQTVLDAALYDDGVYSYWNRKTETAGQDPDEYIVYTFGGDDNEVFADDKPLVTTESVTVRYYFRDTLIDTYSGRKKVNSTKDKILKGLQDNGFSVPHGCFDAGDIDNIGFGTKIFECEYWRVV